MARTGTLSYAVYGFFGLMSAGLAVSIFWLLTQMMPDGRSAQYVVDFFTLHHSAVTRFLMLIPLVLAMLITACGAIAGKLYTADTSPGHRLSWIGFASNLGSLISFSLEIGIIAAANALASHVDGQVIHALYVTACASAFVLGGLWLPFLLSFVMISRRSRIFPTWLEALAVATILMNSFSWLVALTITGPFNGQIGLIALGLPTVGSGIFLFMLIATVLEEDLTIAAVKMDEILRRGY